MSPVECTFTISKPAFGYQKKKNINIHGDTCLYSQIQKIISIY